MLSNAVVLSEGFAKVANAPLTGEIKESDYPAIMEGFIGFMKNAGADPFTVMGFLQSLAEENGMPKEAGFKDTLLNIAGGDYSSLPSMPTWKGVKDSLNPANLLSDESKGKILDANLRAHPEGGTSIQNMGTEMFKKDHPTVYGAVNSMTGGNATQNLQIGRAFQNGDYAGALGKVWNGQGTQDFIKKVTPYATAGLLSFGGAKLMGASTGTALGLGLAGGAAGGLMTNGARRNGSIGGWINNEVKPMFTGTPPAGPIGRQPNIQQPAPTPGADASTASSQAAAANAHAAGATNSAQPMPVEEMQKRVGAGSNGYFGPQ